MTNPEEIGKKVLELQSEYLEKSYAWKIRKDQSISTFERLILLKKILKELNLDK